MKKTILSIALVCMSLFAYSQSSYEKIMTTKIAKIETCKSAEEFQALANDFQRVSDKEKGEWLPSYYAAFSQIQKGRLMMREGKTANLDPVADEAQKYLDVALGLSPDNSEILLLQKMIYSLKMMVNPQERHMTFGMKAEESLKKAEAINPENPRVALIKAEDLYFTPEQFGGSKEKGLALFKQAILKFDAFKPEKELSPNWGKSEAEYFLSLGSKK